MEKTVLALILSGIVTAGPSIAAEIESLTTPGGTRLYHIQVDESAAASIRIRWPSDWILDENLNPVVPQIATQLIQSGGAGELDREENAAAFQNLEVQAQMAAVASMVRSEVLVPAANLDEMATLVNTVLTRPTFARHRLDEIKNSTSASLEAIGEGPAILSVQLAASLLYPDSPLRRFSTETGKDSVRDVARADVIDFHGRTLTRRDATVVTAGPFDAERASALTDAMLEGLPEGGGAEYPETAVTVPRLTVALHAPDAENSLIILIGAVAEGASGDALADQIVLGMFGQSPASELNSALRAEFGGNPNFVAMNTTFSPATRLVQIIGESETGNLPRTLDIVRESYTGFRTSGPTTSIDPWKTFFAQAMAQAAENVHVQTLQIEENLIQGIAAQTLLDATGDLEAISAESLLERLQRGFPTIDEFLTIVITSDPNAVPGACVIEAVDDYVNCFSPTD